MDSKLRSEKLRKVAMVLQDAGEYADGETYAREALKALKKDDEGFFVTKVMLCNTFLNKLKMPMYWSGGADEVNKKFSKIYKLKIKIELKSSSFYHLAKYIPRYFCQLWTFCETRAFKDDKILILHRHNQFLSIEIIGEKL